MFKNKSLVAVMTIIIITATSVFFFSSVLAAAAQQPTITNTKTLSAASYSVPGWKFAGPRTALNVQPTPDMPVSSAASSVVKVDGGAFLLATVNGGVWRTTDSPLTVSHPHWVSVFDTSEDITCVSMSTLHVSASNAKRVYAGCGASTSSQQGYAWNVVNDGGWTGFAVSEDAGLTWKMAPGFPVGYSIESILELPGNGGLLVGVRGSYVSKDDGGIFKASPDWRSATWTRVYSKPIFDMKFDSVSQTVFASAAATTAASSVVVSGDMGATFENAGWATGLKFNKDETMQPFFSCLTITPGKAVFLGVLLATPAQMEWGGGASWGAVFYLNTTSKTSAAQLKPAVSWQRLGAQPMEANPTAPSTDCKYDCNFPDCCTTLDGDFAAKDRMALLVNPDDDSQLFVAGNGGFTQYRVDWQVALQFNSPCTYNYSNGKCLNRNTNAGDNMINIWKRMINQDKFPQDTINGAQPHVDCRFWFYDTATKVLILLSDGGIFLRFKPSTSDGWWQGWAGDIATFEYVHASLDTRRDVFIAGAQDNCVHIQSQPGNASAPALSFTGGDGLVTAVDNTAQPSAIFYGAVQNNYETNAVQMTGDGPFSIAMLNAALRPIHFAQRGFPQRSSSDARISLSVFPFMPSYFVLNSVNQKMMYFWANASSSAGEGPGMFRLDLSNTSSVAQLVFPTLGGKNLMSWIAGGKINNASKEDLVVAASDTGLYFHVDGQTTFRKYPTPFKMPCAQKYDDVFCGSQLGTNWQACTDSCETWPTHGATMTITVSDEDATWIAVTGWSDLEANNGGDDHVYLSTDGGATFRDVVGNLREASGVDYKFSKVRPLGIAFVGKQALLVGTARGVCIMRIDQQQQQNTNNAYLWWRMGSVQTEFPMVRIAFLTYYPDTDVLLCATLGRGLYKLPNMKTEVSRIPAVPSPSNNVTTTAAPSNGNTTNENTGKSKVAVAVGVSIAGAVVILALALWWWNRRRNAERATGSSTSADSQAAAYGQFTAYQATGEV